jgi:glycosyltransferase involved in cell wall biosynthesis
MSTPRVSIILPSFNRAHLLPRAIASVQAQTVTDWELSIVDDASTDDTPALLQRIAGDARIRTWRLATNQGQAAARNRGIEAARGKFLAFIDSDDEWLPEMLAILLDAWERASCKPGVVHCDMLRVRRSGSARRLPTPEVRRDRLINPVTRDYQVKNLGITSVLITPECPPAAVRFDERLRAFEDLELLTRLAGLTDFLPVHRPQVRYHAGAGVSTGYSRVAESRRRLVYRHREWFARHPEALALQYGKIARAYLRGGQVAQAKVFARRAIVTAPRRLSIGLPALAVSTLAPLLGRGWRPEVAAGIVQAWRSRVFAGGRQRLD